MVNYPLVNFTHSEEVYEIEAFVFAGVKLFIFLYNSFLCGGYGISFNFWEGGVGGGVRFWQLSFDLSIKSTHKIECSKVT